MNEEFRLPLDDGHLKSNNPLREKLEALKKLRTPVSPILEPIPEKPKEEPVVEINPTGALVIDGKIVVPPHLPGRDAFGD